MRREQFRQEKEPPPPSVSVSEPVRKMVTEWDEFTGRFQAVDHVSIRPRVSGYLQSAHFQEGSMVKKGDLLFVIDPRPYEAVAWRRNRDVWSTRPVASPPSAQKLLSRARR